MRRAARFAAFLKVGERSRRSCRGRIRGARTAPTRFTASVKGQDSWQALRFAIAPITITVAPAGGMRIVNPDLAAARLVAPLASPANCFEMTFQAEAGVAYHLWMRGKAEKNAWANDSIYVQFSGTVDANGAALYRIGTTSAPALSIEDGTNAGLSGWGWADDSHGGFASPLYFATSGLQTIRVQVREDGLSLDQIVLSADKYAAKAPGVTKNDTTILAK
jgi:hypothetical protein